MSEKLLPTWIQPWGLPGWGVEVPHFHFPVCRYVQSKGNVNVLQGGPLQSESYLFCAEKNVWRDGTFRFIPI